MDILLKRIIALFIDYLIAYIPSFIINKLLNILVFKSELVINNYIIKTIYNYLVFFIIFIIYTIYMEYKYKRTIGKMYTKLRIVYSKKTLGKIIYRSIIKGLSLTVLYGLIGIASLVIMLLYNPELSIHDYLVGSKVCLVG
ncbi:MAG: RDD family protein [Erysipelotrichaceae bacterium]|nr:RDD family protein [Erysipelotrichaceae bacterium]